MFAIKHGHLVENIIVFICCYKHLRLTATIGKWVKTKSSRIDSGYKVRNYEAWIYFPTLARIEKVRIDKVWSDKVSKTIVYKRFQK